METFAQRNKCFFLNCIAFILDFMKWRIVSVVTFFSMLMGFIGVAVFHQSNSKELHMDFNEMVIGLRDYYSDEESYPAYSVEELFNDGCLNETCINFINRRNVDFNKFSSTDQLDKVVVRVSRIGKDWVITKNDIINPPFPVGIYVTFNCSRKLSSKEKSAVFHDLVIKPESNGVHASDGMPYTVFRIKLKPTEDGAKFVSTLSYLGDFERIGKRNFKVTLNENFLLRGIK